MPASEVEHRRFPASHASRSPIAYRTARPILKYCGPWPVTRSFSSVRGDRLRYRAAARVRTYCCWCVLSVMFGLIRSSGNRGERRRSEANLGEQKTHKRPVQILRDAKSGRGILHHLETASHVLKQCGKFPGFLIAALHPAEERRLRDCCSAFLPQLVDQEPRRIAVAMAVVPQGAESRVSLRLFLQGHFARAPALATGLDLEPRDMGDCQT